jgi:2-polyprenyl-3-methyl-5-hydroxy-6-metoxy-1,4-benzoquinol methylase
MLEHHQNDIMRYQQQVDNAANYVLPFIEKTCPIVKGLQVLELGCAEGGVMKPFADKGCICVGVDLNEFKLTLGAEYLKNEIASGAITLLKQNIFDDSFLDKYKHTFDLIILKDVIEHLFDQEKFLQYFKLLLKPKGQVFFGFPPWQMPFGGHQQIVQNKLLSKLPYYHLLPAPIYKQLLNWAKEDQVAITELLEIKETGISIERFERLAKTTNYTIINKQWFLINPIYIYKFGLRPRNQNALLGGIPFVRNFFTTCAYYTLQ